MKLGLYLLGPNDENQGVYVCDARELAQAIPDERVDMIFTDPPYAKEYLPLYYWAARAAARILKPSKFALAMCGSDYMDERFNAFRQAGLTYYWEYHIHLLGARTGVVWKYGNQQVPIVNRIRSVLAFSKGRGLSRCATIDVIQSLEADKRFHLWQQDEWATRYYVDCFSQPGDVVIDFFCGTGTTAAMCKILDRQWLTFELEEGTAQQARERITAQYAPLVSLPVEQLALSFTTSDKRDLQ